jgi:DNA-directed RNA polymerase subunit alpha
LDANTTLNMELTVGNGKGYVPASQQFDEDKQLGVIPIDAIYSPVKRVVYKVEPTRVGQRTDYDKLIMRVHTNGALRPDDAIALAARILQEQFRQFINFEEPQAIDKSKSKIEIPFNPNLLKRVEE